MRVTNRSPRSSKRKKKKSRCKKQDFTTRTALGPCASCTLVGMEVLIFIAVIVALIVVHEFGHFVAAKLSGMRVDEFGIGYPPRALTFGKWGETEYTLNWLPFGGFVKIYGEDGEHRGPRSFSARPRILQAIVLVAGVAMNLVFAYVLITGALVAGTPRSLSPSEFASASDVQLAIAEVVPGSPAAQAGLAPGDTISAATDAQGAWTARSTETLSDYVTGSGGSPITLTIETATGQREGVVVTPARGLIPSDPSRYALGVAVGTIGVVPMSLGRALVDGARLTWATTVLTAQGLWHFFYGIATLSANLSQVAGPVGIAGAVGAASQQGFGDLLSLMAVISINLALINLIPVPALDGGRLLFVIIEGISRKRIKPSLEQAINGVGFALLVLLMVVVTFHDVFKLVGG